MVHRVLKLLPYFILVFFPGFVSHSVFSFHIFHFVFQTVCKGIVKCRSWPELDDGMSISAMDGKECCTIFIYFKLTLIYKKGNWS